jgi:hypothetical protein
MAAIMIKINNPNDNSNMALPPLSDYRIRGNFAWRESGISLPSIWQSRQARPFATFDKAFRHVYHPLHTY